MTDEQIINSLAVKVMGWAGTTSGMYCRIENGLAFFKADASKWNPIRSDADSCAVLDKMVENGWSYSISANPPWSSCLPGTLVEFNKGVHPPAFLGDRREYDFPSHCDDRRRAICIAALKAVGAYEK